MNQAFQLSVGEDHIGRLVFDLPNEKINKLSAPVLEELEKIIDSLKDNKEIKALLITSGKEDIFIAGADIKSFEKLFEDPSNVRTMLQGGQRIFNKLENLPFPTIAVIDGACLGGGGELALACTYRIVTDNPKTLIGQPEVSLGIIPGWGGTQRVPRLVGLLNGLDIILTGKPVKAYKAWKIHLADAIVPKEFKEEKVNEFVAKCLTPEGRKKILEKRKPHGLKHWLLEANPLGRAFVFWKAEKSLLAKTKGHYPAPLLALNVIKESYGESLDKGLKIEANALINNFAKASGISKNLIGLYFTSEALKKDTGGVDNAKPIPVKSVGVLGGGIMGSGISWLVTSKDIPVRMKDIDYTAVGKGFGAVKGLYDQYVKDKRLKRGEAAMKFIKLSGTTELTGFHNVDLVVEAATENLELKNKLFAELEEKIRPDTIVATNTSSLSIAAMSKAFRHPERFIGMHFFNPVNRMPLVEIVPGVETNAETIATAVEFCKKMGKTPIVVGDCAGFLVNRIFVLGANEVLRMLEEGVPREALDKMMLDFGFPMAPFVLADEVGNDVGYKVTKVLEGAYGERMQGPKLLDKLYESKLFGKKAGKGFYIWNGKKHTWNNEIDKLISGNKKELSGSEMRDRVLLVMVNEAARCLEEKIVERPDYLDMALIMGTGFPPFRGGLLRYADTLGIPYVVDHLSDLEKKYGIRFKPCELLLEMRKSNQKFYSNKPSLLLETAQK